MQKMTMSTILLEEGEEEEVAEEEGDEGDSEEEEGEGGIIDPGLMANLEETKADKHQRQQEAQHPPEEVA